jgi:hypothetical protein
MTTITPLLRVKERIVGPSGLFNITNEWYGYADEFKYTIGLAGLMGFGVGCCPPELLPPDMALLPGTEDRFSANYGTYIHVPSASIQCFVPSHYMDVQAVGDTNAPFYGTKVVISNTQSGDAVLPKAFQNNGSNLAGVFIDKYQGSNCKPDGSGQANHSDGIGGTPLTGGIFASRPLHWPVSALTKDNGGTDFNSPFSLCNSDALNAAITDSPSDNLGGVWQLCKTRGAAFAPLPIWVRGQVAFLSLAHAQALLDTSGAPIAGATNNAAWMDVVPYAPKGNNNNAGADTNKTSLQFARTDLVHSGSINANGFAGRASRAFTGAGRISSVSAVEHTTHNGQLSGIVDIGHNQFDTCPGLTAVGTGAGDFRLFPASADWTATSSNTSITGAAGVISLAAESDAAADDGVWWDAAGVSNFLVGHADGTFHPSSAFADATLQAMTECILPRELGTSLTQTGTNIYGGDRFFSARVNNLLPLVGGSWDGGASAGVFSVSSQQPSPPATSTPWCAGRAPSVRVSGHAGEAAASPSPREERYWLIERRCKDLCLYLDVLTRNMPRYEKYVLSAKMREIGYLCLELAIAANKKQHKKTDLTRFNVQHELLRQLLNLAVEAKFIEPRRHRVASVKVDEVGRLLGGWLRSELRVDS